MEHFQHHNSSIALIQYRGQTDLEQQQHGYERVLRQFRMPSFVEELLIKFGK
jgi:hypothetical protein